MTEQRDDERTSAAANSDDTVEITVTGAVEQCGRLAIPAPATMAEALVAAGGFEHPERRWPSGVLMVQRSQGGKRSRLWRFDTDTRAPEEWEDFELQSGDMLTVRRLGEDAVLTLRGYGATKSARGR